jgi:hypothetical protein
VRLCVPECPEQSCSLLRRILLYVYIHIELLGKTFSAVGVNYSSPMCVGAALKPFVIPCQTVPECVCMRLNCKPSKQLILRRRRRVRPFRLIKISTAHHQHSGRITHTHTLRLSSTLFYSPSSIHGRHCRDPILRVIIFRTPDSRHCSLHYSALATTPFGVISPELSHRRLISSYFKEDA